MPGPGVELIGEEEIAEVMQVLKARALSRYGSESDPGFGAKVRKVEQEIASLAGVRYGLGLHGGGSSGLFEKSVIVVFVGTAVAPLAGRCTTMDGRVASTAVPVVNVLWKSASALPARSVTPLVATTDTSVLSSNVTLVRTMVRLSADS